MFCSIGEGCVVVRPGCVVVRPGCEYISVLAD